VKQDLSTLFAKAGLDTEHTELAFMSKVMVLCKPG
jgi:hypothetical protein